MAELSSPSAPRLAGIGAIIVALLVVVVLTACWNRGSQTNERPLLALFPQDPSVDFRDALRDMRRSQGRSVAGDLPAIERAARFDPLDASPLFFASLHRVLTKREANVKVLEAARTRNPRFAEPRLLLLDLYGRSGRANDAVSEAQALVKLMPGNRDLIIRLIAGLAGRPGGLEALEKGLPGSAVRGQVMLRLEQTGTSAQVLQRLAWSMRGTGRDPTQRKWIASLVQRLGSRGDPAAARTIWADLYGIDRRTAGTQLSDPGFDQADPRPPFDWSLSGGRAGVAEIRDGRLNVFYYGRSNAVFARQMLALPAGKYRLSTAVSPSSGVDRPVGLSWNVVCQGERKALVAVPIDRADPRMQHEFTVPAAGCASQALELSAKPTDERDQQSAQIDRILIEPAP